MKPYQEIKFKRDTTFRKQFFVPDSFAHPAKMDAQLLIWIVERYTSEGETILDPMAGSGTMMLACGLGRNVVLVELEDKFCKMMRENWEEVRMRPQLGYEMGNCQIIQGDARNLQGVVDKIVTSPPYAGAEQFLDKEWINKEQPRPHRPQVDKCIFSPPYAERHSYPDAERERLAVEKLKAHPNSQIGGSRIHEHCSENPDNIGQLPYGSIDKIVTSPPYAEGAKGPSRDPLWNRLANDPTSARYGRKHHPSIGEGYSESPDNLGNLPYGNIDAVVTSPPYEGSASPRGRDRPSEIAKLQSMGYNKKLDSADQCAHDFAYSDNQANIGNLKSVSYLEAMLQVYQQCHSVLKEGGLMILVTKNFIRNKQVIRLDTDTIKLCEQAGFTYLERYYRKLSSQSFWRVIYHQRHPEVEQIEHEDVLVFRKMKDSIVKGSKCKDSL